MKSLHLLFLTLLLTSLTSCGGGSAVQPDPLIVPRILGVTPIGAVGQPGEQVTFTALFEEAVTAWSWTFSAGSTPATSTDVAPVVTLGAVGSYSGSVIASNADGASTPFAFAFEVTAAPVPPRILAVLGPTGVVEGDEFTFAAITGNVDSWSWTFTEGVIAPLTSVERDPHVYLGGAGTLRGLLVVGNEAGTAELPFEFTIHPAATPPVIGDFEGPKNVGGTGSQRRFGVVSSGAVTWEWEFNGATTEPTSNARFPVMTLGPPGVYTVWSRASNSAGTSEEFRHVLVSEAVGVPQTWTSHVIGPSTTLSFSPRGIGVTADGIIGLVWSTAPNTNSTGTISFTRSTTGTPEGIDDWQSHTIVNARSVPPLLTALDDRWGIVYGWHNDTVPVSVAHSGTTSPSSAADWAVTSTAGLVYEYPWSSANLAGRLAFQTNRSRVYVAKVDTPVLPTDWAISEHSDNLKPFAGLLELNGRLWAVDSNGVYFRSQVAEPTAATDWTTHAIGLDLDGYVDVASVGGRPAVLTYDQPNENSTHATMYFLRASSDQPTSAANWGVFHIGDSGPSPHSFALTTVDGLPVVLDTTYPAAYWGAGLNPTSLFLWEAQVLPSMDAAPHLLSLPGDRLAILGRSLSDTNAILIGISDTVARN